jgi:DNA-binding LacI/PurR family transcriptional regulator
MPNVEGAQAATAHLISRGCARVVMLGGEPGGGTGMSPLRFTGYQQALAAAGLPFDPSLVVPLEQATMSLGRDSIRRLVQSGAEFDGVFCVTDTVAFGALRGLADEGVDVPGQVKVIGFDDIEESKYLVPSLSSIHPDHSATARTAVDLLVRRIQGKDRDYHATEVVSKYSVVARESTGVR